MTRASEEEQEVADERQHPDASVRGPQRRTEEHHQRTGDGRADDGAEMTHRVDGGERDGALGDERRPQQPGRLAVLALGLGEELGADRRGERHREGATMPAAMTAAMIFSCGASAAAPAVARPVVAKRRPPC